MLAQPVADRVQQSLHGVDGESRRGELRWVGGEVQGGQLQEVKDVIANDGLGGCVKQGGELRFAHEIVVRFVALSHRLLT